MKGTILTLTLLLGLTTVFAQSAKVQSGFTHMKYNELDKAKDCFDQAAVHPKSSTQAKTFMYRGQCYYKLNNSKNENFKNLDNKPLLVAYHSFKKAMELDTKKRFEKELLYEILRVNASIFNMGTDEFEAKKYESSLESYETVIEIGNLPYINQTDTAAYYNAALAADQAGLYDKALEYYEKTAEFEHEGSKVFKYMADLQMAKGDTLAALNSYSKGIETYPNDNVNLYIDLINFYLKKDDLDQAAKYVEKALEKDSSNASLWYVYGQALEEKAEDKAIEAFDKAIEIDPEYWLAMYMAGSIHFNRGVVASKAAQEIPLDDKDGYEAAKEKTNAHFSKALPYFERVVEIEDSDAATLKALKELYYRFQMTDKLEEINKKIEKLL